MTMKNEEKKENKGADDFANNVFGDIIDESREKGDEVTYDTEDQKRQEVVKKVTRTS